MNGPTKKMNRLSLLFTLILGVYASATPGTEPAFLTLDQNHDGQLVRREVPDVHVDAFIFGDGSGDGALNKKEYQRYHFFLKRIHDERMRIPENARQLLDLPYVVNGHERQTLDLYLPEQPSTELLPLVIWVHGGSWSRGSKQLIGEQCRLLEKGFAVASINYRLTDQGPMPMQIHDCKAAVRFLRKHASEYGIDPQRFGAWGASAGGHLVALLGTTDGVPEMEGALGVTGVSSKIQAMCLWFTPTDIIEMSKRKKTVQTTREGAWTPTSPMSKLIGGLIVEHPDWARAASPTTYVTSDDTPCFMMHGHADPLVPLNQSLLLLDRLNQAGVECELLVLQKTVHGWPKDSATVQPVATFFERHLKGDGPQ